ncbi:MAG: hypothetical protein ABI451_07450 [Dokdonella sp.]
MNLLTELKRRNVIRMAGLYLVGAWLLVQVASTVLPAFDVPAWALRALIILLAIGFVPALVIAWVFELTPQGLKRDEDVKPQESIAPQTARRMDRLLLVVSLLALGYFAFDKFVLAPHRQVALVTQDTETATAETVAAKPKADAHSIAVLPFTDLSPGHDRDYFSDGIAEELLNALAQVKDLKVAGRTSSFYYKGRNEDLRSIGKALGVANVLEGSVRTQGDKVRITAQLIRSEDGFHLWSESYDGDLKDVFAVQERIARAITDQLQIVLAGKQAERLVNAGTENPEAYALYLQATGAFNRRDGTRFPDAIAQLTEAIRLDPNFARAYSRLAAIHAVAPIYTSTATIAASFEAADKQLNVAMKLDTRLAEPYAVLGYVRTEQRRQVEAGLAFRRALELDPDDVTANFWHGIALLRAGYTKQGIAALDHVLVIDPLLPNGLNWRGVQYAYAGDLVNAERLSRRAQDVGLLAAGWGLSIVAEARGQRPEATKQLASFLGNIMPGFPPSDSEILARGIYGDPSARADAVALINRYLASKPASLNSGMIFALFRLGESARALTLAPERLTGNDGVYLTLLWSPNGREARATPEFQTFIHRFDFVDLWDKYGPPDICHKTDKGEYACK